MAFGRSFSEDKPLSEVQLCEKWDGLIYVNTYKQRDRLRIVQVGSFTWNTGWQFYI